MTEASAAAVRAIRAVYLHHVGPFGGASRSMMEMIVAFPAGTVDASVLLPRGQVAAVLRSRNIPVQEVSGGISQFDNCAYSYYRGFRWLVLLRELFLFPVTAMALLRARKAWTDVELIHINEITMIPALLVIRLLWPQLPVVVHVRSVQRIADSWRNRWIEKLLRTKVDAVVAIDETVRASLPASLDVTVIHNGFTVAKRETAGTRALDARFTVAMVGSISRVKGCVEFAQAAAICKSRGLDVRFVYVGEAIRAAAGIRHWLVRKLGVSQEVGAELRAIIDGNGLHDCVEFRPFTTDLAGVYGSIDAICFPSHFDAPGRPIFEAAFFGVPAIAAITAPKPDTIVDGKTGLTIRPRSAEQLAAAIERLYRDRALCARLGQAAKGHAEETFDAAKNAARMLGVYRRLCAH